MDPRVTGAGVAMAIGMMVLLPTFNALNNSYVTDVAPPSWLAKLIDPENLPEDFQPPEDFEPPEDMELPEDFEIPPDWEIPPGYDGPIPAGGCAAIPPIFHYPASATNKTVTMDPQFTSQSFTFIVPDDNIVAVVANITIETWRAQTIWAELESPEDTLRNETNGAEAGLLTRPTPQPTEEYSQMFVVDLESQDPSTMPPPGEYTLTLGADLPIDGTFHTLVYYVEPCGGLLG